jgi:hypothetical protein
MYSNISNQNLFIDGMMVSGITSLNLTYDTNITPSFAIDDSGINYLASQPIRANLSVNLIGNSNDPFVNYTGNKLFSGRVEYGNRYIEFQSGALNSYSIKHSKYSPIEVGASAVIYGEIGQMTGNYNIVNYNQALPIYNFHYVDIDLNEINSNPVNSFDITITSNRNEVYEIGEILPTYIQSIYPISTTLNCSLEINEFNYENIRDIINNLNLRYLNVNLKNLQGTSTVRTIELKDLILVSKNMSLSSQSNGTAELSFTTFIVSGES